MNFIRLFSYVTPGLKEKRGLREQQVKPAKPSAMQLLLFYVLPLSLIPCVMMYLRLHHNYPSQFMDRLPGNRLIMISGELFILQIAVILAMAWITQNLAEMVDKKPSFRDSLLIIAIATTPLWLTSVFYMVPSLSFNVIVHAIAVLASIVLVYRGVKYIFAVKERGAIATLTLAIVCTAGLGFAVVMVGSLISWEAIEQLQFAIKKS